MTIETIEFMAEWNWWVGMISLASNLTLWMFVLVECKKK